LKFVGAKYKNISGIYIWHTSHYVVASILHCPQGSSNRHLLLVFLWQS